MKLIIASTNLHKIREFKGILKPLFPQFDLYSLVDFPNYVPPEETGETFVENAEIKASHAAKFFNALVLADDSGLVVPALNGEPGVRSARYSGQEASDQDNRLKLIEKLNNLNEKERVGYYECALSLASPEGLIKSVRGFCEGFLSTNPQGGNGFGYDPLFTKYDYNKTFAELDESTKNRISHRRKAFDKMLPAFESIAIELQS